MLENHKDQTKFKHVSIFGQIDTKYKDINSKLNFNPIPININKHFNFHMGKYARITKKKKNTEKL